MMRVFTPKKIFFSLSALALVATLVFTGINSYAGGNTWNHGFVGKTIEMRGVGEPWPHIPGVRVTFTDETGQYSYSVLSNINAYYRLDLPVGKYYASATHIDYYPYSTYPQLVEVISAGYKKYDFFLTHL